jgi:hypothetical protein
MKKVLTIAIISLILTMAMFVYAATSTLTFGWQQSVNDLPTLKAWRIYKSNTSGSGYTLFQEILYNGTPQQEYSAVTSLTQPDGSKTTYYFVCRAVGTNNVESGNSNEVTAVVDWTAPSVPIMFKVTVTN